MPFSFPLPLLGKTTTATLVARETGRDVLELNASDARSKKALTEALGDVTGSHVISFDKSKAKVRANEGARSRILGRLVSQAGPL